MSRASRVFRYWLVFWLGVYVGGTMATDAHAGQACVDLTATARVVMAMRQVGIPLEKVYPVAQNETTRQMILLAYEEPQYATRGFQRQSIDKFAARVFKACIWSEYHASPVAPVAR